METAASRRGGTLGVDFHIGEWLVDPASGCIESVNARRHLRSMLMDLLLLLAENAGSVVSREEILDRVWKSRFVGDSALSRSIAELREILGDRDRQPRYIETLPKRGYRLIAAIVPGRRFAENRLAVLPFQNLNGDPEQEYFADGVAELLTTELARISSLRVISRQSVLHLKNAPRKVPEIGRELGVDALVEGSVLRAADRLRITAQLIRITPEEHLWAEVYECDVSDILRVQARVARSVAEAIQAALTPAELSRLSQAPAVNREAHEDYLRALYYFTRATRPDLEHGMGCLHSAIRKDPSYAPAWAELANVQGFLGFWGFVPHPQATAVMREATAKALALDDDLSQAHVQRSWLAMFDWEWSTAEKELLRAVELNPSNVNAHDVYGMFLAAVRNDAAGALAEADRVLELDPLSPRGNSAACWTILLAGDYERATAQASLTLEMYPQALHALYVLGCAKLAQSKPDEAVAAFQKVMSVSPEDRTAVAMLGHAYGRMGQHDAARELLQRLLAERERAYVPEMNLVFLHAGLHDMDRAFASLENCCLEHEPKLFSLRAQPIYEPLREDARFWHILRRLGLVGEIRPKAGTKRV